MSSPHAHAAMANPTQIVVDKSYFDTLLRRADFHTANQVLGRTDPTKVTIPRGEYDKLLQVSRQYESLKNALFQGGLTPETLALLISDPTEQQPAVDSWADQLEDSQATYQFGRSPSDLCKDNEAPWKPGANFHKYRIAPYSSATRFQGGLRVPSSQRHASNGLTASSTPGYAAFDEGISSIGDDNTEFGMGGQQADTAQRTLYFCGFPPRTTYRDLLSVIKGGRILSINRRSEWSATVTFHEGAADYLAWVKRNDIYIHSKRVEVRWADRQFHLNHHVNDKVASGATRNIVIRNATQAGLTAERIRDDMEHIHNLVIIDITLQNGHAYVSTNSIHNALFARTCMMSRTTYRGCKVQFYPDECEVPLPIRTQPTETMQQKPAKKQVVLSNRFHMLDAASDSSHSDIENRDPLESTPVESDDDETVESKSRHGIRLDFLDSGSEV